MTKPTRVYTKDTLAVEWRPELCVHCGECISGLPNVFDMEKKPWVNINGATEQEIKKQVLKCPSKALALGEVNEINNT